MERKPTCLVVGQDGAIGSRLVQRLAGSGLTVLSTTRRATGLPHQLQLDLANEAQEWTLPPADVAFFCVSGGTIKKCREYPQETRKVNIEGTVTLARRLAAQGTHVVQLSTSQVFDGTRPKRKEDEPPCPLSEYGRQKTQAENMLNALGDMVSIVRLTKVLGRGVALFDSWRSNADAGRPIEVFTDLYMAPVSVDWVTDVLLRLALEHVPGIVHVSANRDVSYEEVARHLADRFGWDKSLIKPLPVCHRGINPQEAPRHTTLNTGVLTKRWAVSPPDAWETVDLAVAHWQA